MLSPHLSGLAAVAAAVALLGCSEPVVAVPPPAVPAPAPVVAPPAPAEPAPPATVQLGGGCDEAKTAYVTECQRDPSSCAESKEAAGTVSYGSILNQGTYLTGCGHQPSTAVKVCAAIRAGRAVAVTVTTTPGDARLSNCIGKAVQAMAFPSSRRLDVTSTNFAAE